MVKVPNRLGAQSDRSVAGRRHAPYLIDHHLRPFDRCGEFVAASSRERTRTSSALRSSGQVVVPPPFVSTKYGPLSKVEPILLKAPAGSSTERCSLSGTGVMCWKKRP
jgi:hypothetical protein